MMWSRIVLSSNHGDAMAFSPIGPHRSRSGGMFIPRLESLDIFNSNEAHDLVR